MANKYRVCNIQLECTFIHNLLKKELLFIITRIKNREQYLSDKSVLCTLFIGSLTPFPKLLNGLSTLCLTLVRAFVLLSQELRKVIVDVLDARAIEHVVRPICMTRMRCSGTL